MKTIFKAAALAAVSVGVISVAPVASAQAVAGLAVADLEEAVQKSNAAVLATNQIKITHKATIDAVDARTQVLNNEYRGMVQAFQNAQRAPNPNQTALQQQAAAIQKKQQDAQAELQAMARPYSLAEAYAIEQIRGKLEQAVKNAMARKRVGFLLQPNALIVPPPAGSDITTDVIADLNALVPTVSITPPAGWPNQGGAAPAAPGAAPAKPQPQGR